MLTNQGKKKLSLLIILAFVLTMVMPGLALAAVSNGSVSLSTYQANASCNYTVYFDNSAPSIVYLTLYNSAGGTVALFPAGTGTLTNAVYVNGAVSSAVYQASTAAINNVPAGSSVAVKVYGLTNPAAGSDYYFGVATVNSVVYSAYFDITSSSSGSSSGSSTTTPVTPVTPTYPTAPTAPVSASISGGTSATVATADGTVSVTLPAGAVTGEGTVSITEVPSGEVPAATAGTVVLQIGSKVFEVTLTGAQLTGNVALTFAFDTTAFTDVPADQIGLYYYNETRQGWVFVGGNVDTTTGKVTANVNHFTKFAVMANTKLPVLSDLASHWAAADIKRLVGMMAIGGYADKTFKPDNKITRNEFATILAKAMAWSANSAAADKFADSSNIPAWAKGSVGAAVAKGVINGYTDGTFGGDRLITRSEIAAMVVKALGKPASSNALTFADASTAPAWAKGAIATAVAEGIIKGMPGNVYMPNSNATRAESSTMIVRVLNNLKI